MCIRDSFWSGLKLAYRPLPFLIPSRGKVKKISAGQDSYAVLTDENIIYSNEAYVKTDLVDTETGYPMIDGRFFNNGEILEIGGQYSNCLLYTSPSPRDRQKSRMPSSA
eukprot:TRINITY_DN856_c0_g1_i4.p1 TRINITY_DN856_c0_g1~~TRINITY_DN856_c0_g1_i4.p1  ORF type:complete len:109 (-),score=38.42 TRINITY_DN856_c0_g1_i4:16-342(-)